MTSPRPFSLCLCSIESWGWIFVLGHTLARGTNFFLNSSINLLIFRANSCECYVLFPQKWNCLFPVLAADWREMAAWETYFRWSLFNEGTRVCERCSMVLSKFASLFNKLLLLKTNGIDTSGKFWYPGSSPPLNVNEFFLSWIRSFRTLISFFVLMLMFWIKHKKKKKIKKLKHTSPTVLPPAHNCITLLSSNINGGGLVFTYTWMYA